MANVDTIDITKLIFVEQGSTPSTPAATKQKLFIRSSDHLLCTVDSSGTVTPWGGALTNPMTTSQDIIVGGVAGAPGRLAKGNAGGHLSMINGVLAWDSGTSNPGSAVSGDREWRSDLSLDGFYDGTRWLSRTLYAQPFAVGDGLLPYAANGQAMRSALWHSDFAIWLVGLYCVSYVAGTNDGSHFWTIPLSGTVTSTAYGNFTTAADTGSTYTSHKVALNQVAGSTERLLAVAPTKTSTPGNLYLWPMVTYRLILA